MEMTGSRFFALEATMRATAAADSRASRVRCWDVVADATVRGFVAGGVAYRRPEAARTIGVPPGLNAQARTAVADGMA